MIPIAYHLPCIDADNLGVIVSVMFVAYKPAQLIEAFFPHCFQALRGEYCIQVHSVVLNLQYSQAVVKSIVRSVCMKDCSGLSE